MNKENNCCCVVCQVERNLLNSLSTQTAKLPFQVLARNSPIRTHSDSPADVIAQLDEHERVALVNHKAWNGILHALVDSIADGTAEEIGQQLLLLAYMPAIHKAYAEVCQRFPALAAEDGAQQAALVLLEASRAPDMRNQNGYLPIALARDFHKRLIRWAFGEIRQSVPSEEVSAVHTEPESDENFESAVLLEDFLSQWQRAGVLSQEECDLLRKFKCDGFHRNELATGEGGPSGNALYFRAYRAINRLRRLRASNSLLSADEATQTIHGSIRTEVGGIPGWSALPCGQLVAMESVALELSKQVALFLREHASTLPLREEVLQQHSAFEVLIRFRFWMHSGDFLRRDRLPDFSEGPADQSLVEVSGKCNGQITILVSHGRRACGFQQYERCLLSYVLGRERRKPLTHFGIRFVNCGHIRQEKQLLPDFFGSPVRNGIDQRVQDAVPSLVIYKLNPFVLV